MSECSSIAASKSAWLGLISNNFDGATDVVVIPSFLALSLLMLLAVFASTEDDLLRAGAFSSLLVSSMYHSSC
jgi:hypothetical protein